MPRVQFTVRRLMTVVAVSAVAIGGTVLAQRSLTYAALAKRHAAEQTRLMEAADGADALRARIAKLQAEIHTAEASGDRKRAGWLWIGMPTCGPMPPEHEAECRARASHHAEMRARYEHAARYPWMPVTPELPEPE